MYIRHSSSFKRKFKKLSKAIKQKFRKQSAYLIKDLRHPSLHAKKYDETRDIWQARVDDNYRFYFLISGDTYFLMDIKLHSK